MTTGTGVPMQAPPAGQPPGRPFFHGPTSRLGRWATGLAATFVVLYLINAMIFIPSIINIPWRETVLPFYGIGMLMVGLASGVTGVLAVVRHHERSWLVWLAILPGALMLFLLLGEFLVPH